jgi:hypothetical protein
MNVSSFFTASPATLRLLLAAAVRSSWAYKLLVATARGGMGGGGGGRAHLWNACPDQTKNSVWAEHTTKSCSARSGSSAAQLQQERTGGKPGCLA